MSELRCPHCGESDELDLDCDPADLCDGMLVLCEACEETSVVWLGELVTRDDYHEYSCDSQAAARDEDRAHGDDREEYISGGRWESGYRNGREDFRSDC
jgi:hypothetical protein